MRTGVVALALLLGCATSRVPVPESRDRPPPGLSMDDKDGARQAHEQLLQEDAEVRASSAESRPACPRACELRTSVCELSRLICQVAGRHSDDGDLEARCNDGRDRCEKATLATTERCACEINR
jgi:hypothetical protein